MTDSTLLVEVARAQQQADADRLVAIREVAADTVNSNDNSFGVEPVDLAGSSHLPTEGNADSKVESSLEVMLSRFFGSVKVDSDRYARDIGNVTREVIDRLAGAGARLEITIDIQATKPGGFDESEIRTIGENARVLKFDPSSGFEQN